MLLRRVIGTIVGALALVVGCSTLFAQEELRLELFRPSLEIATDSVPEKDFQDIAGNLRQRRFSLKLNVPLGPTHVDLGGEGLLGYQFFAQMRLSASPVEITLPGTTLERTLYSGALRVTSLMARNNGNLFLVSLGASFAEDEETLDDLEARFSALILGSHRKSDDLMLLYGGIATYSYGKKLILPGFGVLWNFAPKWRLFTVLPLTVRTTYTKSVRTRYHFLLEVVGDRYRFANEGTFADQPQTVFYRTVGARLGTEWEYRPGRDHAFIVQAGVIGGRKLDFSADLDDDDFLSTEIDSAGYLKLGWRYSFGSSILSEIEAESSGP